MAARWLEAKKRKMKRHHLKRWSANRVHTKSYVNKEALNPKPGSESYGEPWYAVNQRAASIGIETDARLEPVRVNGQNQVVASFTRVSNKDGQPFPTKNLPANSPRAEQAEKMLSLEQSWRFQRVKEYNFVYFLNTHSVKIKLYFKSDTFFWVYENVAKNIWKRSILYPSKKLALAEYDRNKVTWVTQQALSRGESSVPTPPPRA